ncbi:MarR family winged helix-turn-helix transcriptional regulator [Paenibacillus hemerocallicola]|uniref:MarR family winged helix-turn-helix transcriptional regulator n=1 Tax=Paenibacillus hemerocallicola TaxID=1172614 RepID=UPI00159EE4D4|nr:MarR family transcriptional regulator [Paenibacillus hemerocallicola]
MRRDVLPGRFPWEEEEDSALLIKLANKSIRREIEVNLRPLQMTPQQAQALRALSVQEGLTNSELELQLFIDKSSVTSLINGMVAREWVIRREDRTDGRRKRIFLTDLGRTLVSCSAEIADQVKRRASQNLNEKESVLLRELLRKVIQVYEPASGGLDKKEKPE